MPLDNKNADHSNKHGSDGFSVSNPDKGEQIEYPCNLEPNKFPREGGSDSAADFAGGDFAG